MIFKKYIGLLSPILCISLITFNITDNTYAEFFGGLFSKKPASKQSEKKETMYKEYIDELSEIARTTNLIDFSWMDIEKINSNDFQSICTKIGEIAQKSETKVKLLLSPDVQKKDNFKILNKIVKATKNLDIANQSGVSNEILEKTRVLIDKLKIAVSSAQKSGILDLCNINNELCDKNYEIISACLARLRLQHGSEKKLVVIYSETINNSKSNGWLEVAKKLDYKTYSTKDPTLALSIKSAINMGYETRTIDLLNLRKDKEYADKCDLYAILNGIIEFAERYNFGKGRIKERVNVLIGRNFDKFYKSIENVCNNYGEKFNIIRELEYLSEAGRLDDNVMDGWLDGVSEKHNNPVHYMYSLASDANIIDTTAYFYYNYRDIEVSSAKENLNEVFEDLRFPIYINYLPAISPTGKSLARCFPVSPKVKFGSKIETTLEYKQILAKKLNTAYSSGKLILNPEQRNINGRKVWYEPAIAVAGLIYQKALLEKSVNSLLIYINLGNSPADKKAREIFKKYKVKIKKFDKKSYKYITEIINNAEVTGVIEFADNKLFKDGENLEMAIACVSNFLNNNSSRKLKLVVGKRMKRGIDEILKVDSEKFKNVRVEYL